MKPIPVGLQLYSVRDVVTQTGDLEGVLERLAEFGYRYVELAGMYDRKPAELRRIMDKAGLKVISNHGPMPSKDNRSELVEQAQALGFSWTVTGRGADAFKTRDDCVAVGRAWQEAAELLEGTGVGLGYHNHWWEFSQKFDGRTALEIVLENAPKALAQVDTYWAATGGTEPGAFIRSLGTRVPTLHIKDGPCEQKKAMTAVGAGVMDWQKVFGGVDSSVTKYLIVELDRCDTDMMTAVKQSIEYLQKQGYGVKA